MMLPKEKALNKVHTNYFELFLNNNFPLGKAEDFVAKSFMGFGTVKDEIRYFVDIYAQIIRQRQQSEGTQISYFYDKANWARYGVEFGV